MGKSGIGCAALVVALMLSSHHAAAAEPYSFGERGQLVIDNRFQLSAGRDRQTELYQDRKYVQVNPSAAYFVVPRLSVGLGVSFEYGSHDYQWGQSYEAASLGVTPRLGYVVPLGERFDFYPELELGLTRAWLFGDGHADLVDVKISAPVLFKPASHFFIGLGPSIRQRWYRERVPGGFVTSTDGKLESASLNWGVTSTIGGYFDI
jgi:hypothetical protein